MWKSPRANEQVTNHSTLITMESTEAVGMT